MIAIIDYGMGNLRSVQKALEKVGAKTLVTQNPKDVAKAEKVVLPGVGAIKPAIEKLNTLGLVSIIKETIAAGKPFLGICLGLQLLFEKSDEGGNVQGLGILKGSVERFTSLKVPHMGWNQIEFQNKTCPLWRGVKDNENVYFCHSYCVKPSDGKTIAATTDYGGKFVSAVCVGNLFGAQFHPEKSQAVGIKILENFVGLTL
jgi:glutamine amidotransferase